MTGGIRVNQQFCLQGALSHSPARGYFTPGLMAPPLPLEGPGVVFPELVGVAGLETGVDAFSLGIDWNGRNDFLKTCIMQMEREWSHTHKSHKSCVHNEINNWEIVSCSTAIDCIRKEEQNQSVYFIPKCNKFNTWNDSKSSLAESFSVYNYCPPATKVINSKREREKKRKEKTSYISVFCRCWTAMWWSIAPGTNSVVCWLLAGQIFGLLPWREVPIHGCTVLEQTEKKNYEINVRNLMLVGTKIYILDVMLHIGMTIYIYQFHTLCEKVATCTSM